MRRQLINRLTKMLCVLGSMALVWTGNNIHYVQAQENNSTQADAQITITAESVSIEVPSKDNQRKEQIALWSPDGLVYYGFLPSYANITSCILNSSQEGISLHADGETCVTNHENLSKIQLGKTYTIQSQDEVLGDVIFIQSSKINTIYIQTESGSMDYINETKGNEETGIISCYTTDGNLEYQGALTQIRGRGNNSWLNQKKPYQIKLDDKINLYEMGAAKTWVLLAGAADGSGIRNKLVFDMAQNMGIPYAQNSEFVDLYLDGEYAGLYLLAEKIQIGKNRIEIEDLEKATEKMNPDMELSETESYTSEDGNRWGKTDLHNPEDITGGYLIERDNYFEEEASAFRLTSGEKFSISSPKYASKEEVDYIADTMQHVENAILATDGIDPETGKNYKELIDFDGLVYKYLFDEVTKCADGWRGSNYFYKLPDSMDTKIYCGPIWDYDLALGNAPEWFVGDDNPQGITQTRLSVWYEALWQKQEFREAVIEKYNNQFKPYLNQMIADGIDQYAVQIQASMKMNDQRWQLKDEHTTIYESFPEQIGYLENFISSRLQYLDEVWNEGQVYYEVIFQNVPRTDNRTDKWEIQYVKEGECAQTSATPTKAGFRFLNWYYQGTTEVFSPYQPVWRDTIIEAGWEAVATAQENTNQNEEGNISMLFMIGLLLLVPGMITMKLSNKKYDQEKNAFGNTCIDICIYDFIILFICYGALTVLGSSGLSVESIAYTSYTIRYAAMVTVIAVCLGIGIRIWNTKYANKKLNS